MSKSDKIYFSFTKYQVATVCAGKGIVKNNEKTVFIFRNRKQHEVLSKCVEDGMVK